MPKRPHPEDINEQPIKKQVTERKNGLKIRQIHSHSAEKTLQLLYNGVTKLKDNNEKKESSKNCCPADLSQRSVCKYCSKQICGECLNSCFKCKDSYCSDCCFQTYDYRTTICYSCY